MSATKKEKKYRCKHCGRAMNVIDYLIGPVCLECCKRNHSKITGERSKKWN